MNIENINKVIAHYSNPNLTIPDWGYSNCVAGVIDELLYNYGDTSGHGLISGHRLIVSAFEIDENIAWRLYGGPGAFEFFEAAYPNELKRQKVVDALVSIRDTGNFAWNFPS